MNSILIPTDYHYDTLHALELTWRTAGVTPIHVILLNFSPVPDSITDYLYSPNNEAQVQARKKLMDEWEARQSLVNHSIQVTEHHQYGASAPVIQQILERFQIRKVIVPYSFQKSEYYLHEEALRGLKKSECKIIWMPERNTAASFQIKTIRPSHVEADELVTEDYK